MPFEYVYELSPEQFEIAVKQHLERNVDHLDQFSVKHREQIKGLDGHYEIDVVVRFTALDVPFVCLVECKHQKNKVKREQVQILHRRMDSIGAHKGILFSCSGFQSGAIKYAQAHGIALATVTPTDICYFTRSLNQIKPGSMQKRKPDCIVWMISLTDEGYSSMSNVSQGGDNSLRRYLASQPEASD